jgi:hypothetical protein
VFEARLLREIVAPAPLAIVACAMVLGLVLLALLRTGHLWWARVAAACEAAAVLCAWYVAQAPYVWTELGVASPAAPDVTLTIFLWASVVGAVVLVPSLAVLFFVFKAPRYGPAKTL